MEGSKGQVIEKVNELLDAGVYQPDLVKLIYDEATPGRVKKNPFELSQENAKASFEKKAGGMGKESSPDAPQTYM